MPIAHVFKKCELEPKQLWSTKIARKRTKIGRLRYGAMETCDLGMTNLRVRVRVRNQIQGYLNIT